MRVYVAGARTDLARVRLVVQRLHDAGHEITSTWHHGQTLVMDDGMLPSHAAAHLAGVCQQQIIQAEVLVLVEPPVGGCGCWWELGYAAGLDTIGLAVLRNISMQRRSVFSTYAHEALDMPGLLAWLEVRE